MTDSTSPQLSGDIHRLLDQAFAGVEMTADAQDLKEEVRANLVARVAELEESGRSSDAAARRAIMELGDVRELVGLAPDASRAGVPSFASAPQRHRVRPKTAFVVRVILSAVVATGALATSLLGALGTLPLPVGVAIALLALGASAAGWIVGDCLAQETTTNHPMPQARAGGYYLASSLMIFGLGFVGLVVSNALPVWAVVFAAIAIVASVALFVFLGATQTNRHKRWFVAMRQDQVRRAQLGNRFEEEPETAARFGIYTVVIWVLAFAAFLVLSFTIGWAWSWLALLGGFVAMMLTLARMLFGTRKS